MLLTARPNETGTARRPAVLLLHSTGKSKEYLGEHLERYAQRGFLAVAFDASAHGERALPNAGLKDISLAALGPAMLEEIQATEAARLEVYYAALIRAWREGKSRPFLFDTVRDALGIVNYLMNRSDVDPTRVGAAGVSLGGMATWLLAAAEPRIAAAAPAIGVQSFQFALQHQQWGARVDSILPVFAAAAKDLGKKDIDAEVVKAVWDRLVPGLAEANETSSMAFDAPASLPCVAPRPLLVLSGEKDPRCPLEGVNKSITAALRAYTCKGAPGSLRLFVEPGVEHEMTATMWREIDAFLDSTLLRRGRSAL